MTCDRNKVIRRLPYPYRGALTIANDAEFLSLPYFETLMTFVNGRAERHRGAAVWASSAHRASSSIRRIPIPCRFSTACRREVRTRQWQNDLRTTSSQDGSTRSMPTAPSTGLAVFERAHAERSFEELNRLGVRLGVFTNHGDDKNIQNIGGDAAYHRGDVPDHEAHHTDLLARHGVRHIWSDSMADEYRPGPKGIRQRWRQRAGFPFLTTEDRKMRDGTAFRGFRRFRGTGANAPNLSSLQRQLDLIDWDALYDKHESIVLYQHLGVLHRVAGECVPATIEAVAARPEVFLAPWRRLAREADEGRLWVVGLARLLAYRELLEGAELVDAKSGELELQLNRTPDDPATDLAGFTLYVDTARPITLRCQGTDLPIAVNGPDETGRYSISVTPARLPDIWS